MNAASNKGGAWGFSLRSLTKLKFTKAADGSTLLAFIVRSIEDNHPEARYAGGGGDVES